jgi:hypothetical protein
LNNSGVFGKIQTENFLKDHAVDVVKSLLKILPQAWILPFAFVASTIIGVRRFQPQEYIQGFTQVNKKLLEERTRMTTDNARRFCDLVIDLNSLAIDMSDKVMKERQLLKKCLVLKKEALHAHSLETAKLFILSADELSSARDACIKVMTNKNLKQVEIIQFLKHSALVERRDLEEIAGVILVDTIASIDAGKLTPLGTAYKTGDLTAKFLAKQMQKTSMSPKILDRGIWLRERSQERFRAWRQSASVRDLVR